MRVKGVPGTGSTASSEWAGKLQRPWDESPARSIHLDNLEEEDHALLSELQDACDQARRQAADAQQTAPSGAAQWEAERLIAALPGWCGRPTPIVENSGAIALEWDLESGHWLVLAVRGVGTIEYSAILGNEPPLSGVWNFQEPLGQEQLGLLRRVMRLVG